MTLFVGKSFLPRVCPNFWSKKSKNTQKRLHFGSQNDQKIDEKSDTGKRRAKITTGGPLRTPFEAFWGPATDRGSTKGAPRELFLEPCPPQWIKDPPRAKAEGRRQKGEGRPQAKGEGRRGNLDLRQGETGSNTQDLTRPGPKRPGEFS